MSLETPFTFVENDRLLRGVLPRMRAADSVAVDIEADSLHHYHEKVCLIQLSFDGEHAIVDPLARFDIQPFFDALADQPLLFHAADYDLRMLSADFGFVPRQPVFDTMLAAQLLGYQQLGLAALVEKHFQVVLEKKGQKADWSRRPLEADLLEYAVGDTRYLHRLAEILRAELAERGRLEWHAQTCASVVRSALDPRPPRRHADEAWRIKGSGRLNPRALAMLREIWLWRDSEACRMDRPAFKVLTNQKIIELIAWAEENPEGHLPDWPGLPRNFRGARLHALADALQAGRTAPGVTGRPKRRRLHDSDLPSLPTQPDEEALVEKLRKERDAVAKQLELDPSVLAPRAMLTALARVRPNTLQGAAAATRMLPWQVDLLGESFLNVLRLHGKPPAKGPTRPEQI